MFKTMLMSFMLRVLNITIFMINAADANTLDIKLKLEGWGEQIKIVLNAVVAVCVIGGGFLIFMQYMQGNDQAQKNLVKLVIGVAVMGLISFITDIFLVGTSTTDTSTALLGG